MGATVVLRTENDEPLKEALAIWGKNPPQEIVDVRREHADGRQLHGVERISLWDCKWIETLDAHRGHIRVVRAEIQDPAARLRPAMSAEPSGLPWPGPCDGPSIGPSCGHFMP